MAEEEINIKVEARKLVKKSILFFHGKEKLIVPIVFLFVIGYCTFLWYGYIYNSKWDEKQKQEYKDNKGKEIVFDENKYNAVISAINDRQKEFEKKIDNVNDVFQLKK